VHAENKRCGDAVAIESRMAEASTACVGESGGGRQLREHGLVGDRDLEGGHEGEMADDSLGRRRSRG
jgi:hypothetical protein